MVQNVYLRAVFNRPNGKPAYAKTGSIKTNTSLDSFKKLAADLVSLLSSPVANVQKVVETTDESGNVSIAVSDICWKVFL